MYPYNIHNLQAMTKRSFDLNEIENLLFDKNDILNDIEALHLDDIEQGSPNILNRGHV